MTPEILEVITQSVLEIVEVELMLDVPYLVVEQVVVDPGDTHIMTPDGPSKIDELHVAYAFDKDYPGWMTFNSVYNVPAGKSLARWIIRNRKYNRTIFHIDSGDRPKVHGVLQHTLKGKRFHVHTAATYEGVRNQWTICHSIFLAGMEPHETN